MYSGVYVCSACKVEKPGSAYGLHVRKDRGGALYRDPRCRECNTARLREYAKTNRPRYRAALKAMVLDAKRDKPCLDCGVSYPPAVMEFDHRPDTVKRFGIGTVRGQTSFSTVRAEMAKCDLVCANCHRMRTEVRRAALR